MVTASTFDDRMSVLRMVEEHKVTAEQGAQLLMAVGNKSGSEVLSANTKGRFFRVLVTDKTSGKVRTSVTLPLSLVKWGMNYGSRFTTNIEGLDLNELAEIITSGQDGKIIDVEDEDDGEHVQIFIE